MEPPSRKQNRIPHYDYAAPGAYFITICAQNRRCIFGKMTVNTVGDGFPVPTNLVVLKNVGKVAQDYILQIPKKYPNVCVDQYVVMPNHIHLLLRIREESGTGNPSPTMGDVIGWYKYQVTKQVNLKNNTPGQKIFQRSYHDHVIRGEKDYQMIWQYIDTNPARWQEDCFFVEQ